MYGGGGAGAAAGAAAAAHAAQIANAIKASGVLVQLEPHEFEELLARAENPLLVVAESGFFGKTYRYLFGHRGLAFHCKAKTPIHVPSGIEIVTAQKLHVPG